jgi:tRNA/rRNA methyltransferase
MRRLESLKIILVEPAGALNLGSVARVMKNMGLRHLVLVNPHCDPWGEEARQMAVHAIDVLESAKQVATLPEALQGCQRAIATTSRSRALQTPLATPREGLPWLLADNLSSALIFGPEDRGLSNAELNYAQRFVCIRSNPEYPSLNLAQAVAICTYELYQAALALDSDPSPILTTEKPVGELAAIDALEGYYQHLESVLLKIGYLYPHTAVARMEKFRRLFNRANLTQEEVAMLRGILGQMNWFLQLLPDLDSQEGKPAKK